ncbi:MAG TPA: MFS transporter [Candidatus Sulfotelmatobacter sp.]|nr:MFS transporter [Candidatus Sulfotelmatobacter sp.]
MQFLQAVTPSARTQDASGTANLLTWSAYVSFLPIGIANVLLGPMLPALSARWSLNYSEAGALFTDQYIAATVAVALSGLVVSFRGFRFGIKFGLILTAASLAFLFTGPKTLGIICIAGLGAGLGIAVPAANLLVAEANPARRGARLNWLNFCWSAGAVASPFLVAAAVKAHHILLFLALLSACCLLVAAGFALMPPSVVEPPVATHPRVEVIPVIRSRLMSFLFLAAVFFIYVGTENGFGGWVASYSKTLGTLSPAISLITPSFFYASLMLGRVLAPALLRIVNEVTLVRAGLVLACAGTGGLMLSHGLAGVLVSACTAGVGLSCVYPISIGMLSTEFGPAATQIASLMFVLSNIGGALLPWIVGIAGTRFGTLQAGLFVPLLGSAAMFLLYLRKWEPGRRARSLAADGISRMGESSE